MDSLHLVLPGELPAGEYDKLTYGGNYGSPEQHFLGGRSFEDVKNLSHERSCSSSEFQYEIIICHKQTKQCS